MDPEEFCFQFFIADATDKGGDTGEFFALLSSGVLAAQTCARGKVIQTVCPLFSIKKCVSVDEDVALQSQVTLQSVKNLVDGQSGFGGYSQ